MRTQHQREACTSDLGDGSHVTCEIEWEPCLMSGVHIKRYCDQLSNFMMTLSYLDEWSQECVQLHSCVYCVQLKKQAAPVTSPTQPMSPPLAAKPR